MERALVSAALYFLVGSSGLFHGQVLGQGDDGVDPGLESFESFQVEGGQPLAGQLLRLDPVGLVLDSGVGDVLVFVGEWAGRLAAGLEPVGLGPDLRAGYRSWVPPRSRLCFWVDGDLPRPGAPLVLRRHRDLPALGGLLALGWRQLDLHELLGLGDGLFGDLRADPWSRAEGGRRAGRQLGRGLWFGLGCCRCVWRDRGGGQAQGGLLEELAAGFAHGGIVARASGGRLGPRRFVRRRWVIGPAKTPRYRRLPARSGVAPPEEAICRR